MQIISTLLIIIYGIIGGVSTLYLLFAMPAIIVWKFYRKFKYNMKLTD